jgi:phosphatidylglycerophosphatase C
VTDLRAPRSGSGAIAAFDVDGTLTTRDCVVPFLRRLAGGRGLAAAIARRPVAVGRGLARRDRDELKEAVVGAVYRGRTVAEVAAIGGRFARDVEETMLRSDVLARLRWHQEQGHRTVLVSASLRAYLDPLASSLGVDDVLCTDVVVQDGRYTERLAGGNCRGAEKAVRLRRWIDAECLGGGHLFAYGDSPGDRPLLELADTPVWVGDAAVPAVPRATQR